jgi:2-oxoglutarate ferredoxin oxidoreductase subunit gamma
MIVLGGFLKLRPIVKMESVILGVEKTLPERHHHLIPVNENAIKAGVKIINKI